MKKITIIIVDDHKLIREMWTQTLLHNKKVEVIGDCGEFNEAIEMITLKRPDIVLLDINLHQASGMDAVPLIRRFSPGSNIIVVTMHSQIVYAKKMLQLGAKGYVTKNSSHIELFKAIDEVMQGQIYICSEIKDIISAQVVNHDDSAPSFNSLSLREIDIIKLIKSGLSSKEMAGILMLSIRTVEVHRHNILKKLKLNNTAALINFINTTELSM
ncbi:MAG: response regulator transcription factor [Ferruginibacter sp.]